MRLVCFPSLFFFRNFLAILIYFLIFIFSMVWNLSAKVLLPLVDQKKECQQIVKILEQKHYWGDKIDNRISSKILDSYLKNLDPFRSLLTSGDVEKFNAVRYKLDNYLFDGDLCPVFEIFNHHLSRAQTRLQFILKLIDTWEKDIDLFTSDQFFIDSEHRPWPKDIETLEKLWKQSLTNEIIVLKLNNISNNEITDTLRKLYSSQLSRLHQINSDDVFQLFMNCVALSFDPHSRYYSTEEFNDQINPLFEGIGVVLQREYEYIKVDRLIPKGPADRSKLLMPGDKIIGVGQGKRGEIKNIIGLRMDEIIRIIRGPQGSYVRLRIIPAGKTGVSIIVLKRDCVALEHYFPKQQVVKIRSGEKVYKIGIIEISSFYIDFDAYRQGKKNYRSISRDVRKILIELKRENIDALIVDLRDNPGGSLQEASELTGLFLKYGPTVQIKTKEEIGTLYDTDPDIEYTGPLVVLINRMSASASEVFTGAIKDYNRGIIVGDRSYGKGTVQQPESIGKKKLILTTGKYYRISGKSTQYRGIEPDIELPGIYSVKTTGESSLDWPLPWDTIDAISYAPYTKFSSNMIDRLTKRFHQRAVKSPEMICLKKILALTEETDIQDTLSLNLYQRQTEQAMRNRKELYIKNMYLTILGKPPIQSVDQINSTIIDYKSIIIKQAEMITADFTSMVNEMGYEWN